VFFSKNRIHRPFAALIGAAEGAKRFFLFLFAERAKRNKRHPSRSELNVNTLPMA
jgi:hypothetical protein